MKSTASGPQRKLVRALIGAGALIAILSGCSAGSTGTETTRLTLSPCVIQDGLGARCGQISVPENPSAQNGRKISLRVVVLPASSSQRAPDPLFYFAGGPGSAATGDATWAAKTFKVLNRSHDFVFIDQRGTGGSNPVNCSLRALSGSSTESQLAAAARTCLDAIKDKADPVYYSTPVAVDDFDLVRAALGYDKIDIYGGSYGVSSALAYIQRHGTNVRAAILDSGSLLDVHLWELVPRSAQQSLTNLIARCRADKACESAYPNLEADFTTVTTQLAKAPIVLYVIDPATGGSVTLDLPDFLSVVVDRYLGSTQGSASFPHDIHAAAMGDWTPITQLFANGTGSPDIQIMALTIRCSDQWAALDPSRVSAVGQGSPFTPMTMRQATVTNMFCKYWPQAVGAAGPVKTSVPIVFLNGTADPADPPANVAGARADMPNSLVIPVAGFGHAQFSSDSTGCLADEATTFLLLGLPSSASSWPCAQSTTLPDFVVG